MSPPWRVSPGAPPLVTPLRKVTSLKFVFIVDSVVSERTLYLMLLAVYAPIDDNASDDDDDDDGGDALWHSSKTRRRMYCVKRG